MALGIREYLLKNFQYYDKPEGQDPINKLLGVSKYGLMTGSSIAIFDGIFYSSCKTTLQALNTWGFWTVPLTSMGLAFASVTYISTNVRGKDDLTNYMLGGN